MAHMPETIIIRKTGETKTAVEYSIVEPKTNADRIRSMSDEELADWLEIVNSTSCAFAMRRNPCHGIGCPCWLSWLKAEVEE